MRTRRAGADDRCRMFMWSHGFFRGMSANSAILDGVTVLEVGTFLTAPKPARYLAEFGAEVVKVERTSGSPFRHSATHGEPVDGTTPLQAIINSGKKSLAVDIASDEGHEIFMRLARDADVLLENMSPGAMDRLGIGYEDVAAVNDEIIYCSISGYGKTGPWKDRKAVDFMAQGMSGLPYQNALRAGGGEPSLSGWFAADELTTAYVTISVLAALLGGEGTHIDISMFDVMLAGFSDQAASYSSGMNIEPPGGPSRTEGPRGIYPTATEPLTLDVLPPTPERWTAFWDLLGLDEWVEEGRYRTVQEITADREFVERRVTEQFRTRPREEWLDLLWDAGFIAAPVLTVEEAFEHEQLDHRRVREWAHDDRIGDYLQLNFPAMFSAYGMRDLDQAADLGAHTRELLERAGYSASEIEAFYDDGIVA